MEGRTVAYMKPGVHQYEDKLLEFAYGELPTHEAERGRLAREGLPALHRRRWSRSSSVRTAMSVLPQEPVPDEGLDSLLAYAEQAARRNASQAVVPPFWAKFRRFVAPLVGVAAVAVAGVVYLKAKDQVDLSKQTAVAENLKAKDDARKVAAPELAEAAPELAQAAPAPAPKAQGNAASEVRPQAEAAAPAAADAPAKPEELKDLAANERKADRMEKKGAEYFQRDDKEVVAKTEAKPTAHASTKTPSRYEQKGAKRAAAEEQKQMLGSLDETRQAGPGSYGLSPGSTAGGGLGTQLGQADKLTRRKAGKSSGVDLDVGGGGDTAKNRAPAPADDERGYLAKGAKSKPSKKKAHVSPADNAGGADVQVATGSLSEAADKKAAEKRPEPAREVAKAEKPAEKENKIADYSNAAQRGATMRGGEGSVQQQEPTTQAARPAPVQQLAPQPPAPVASATPSGSSSSFGVKIGSKYQQQAPNADEQAVEDSVHSIAPKSAASDASNAQQVKQQQLAELMRQARVASDPAEILRLCEQVIRGDATGDLKAEALFRSCQTYQRIGQDDRAAPFCSQLQSQFPSSKWAASLRVQQQEQVSHPAKRSNKAYKADEQYDRAEPATAPPEPKPANAPASTQQAY